MAGPSKFLLPCTIVVEPNWASAYKQTGAKESDQGKIGEPNTATSGPYGSEGIATRSRLCSCYN